MIDERLSYSRLYSYAKCKQLYTYQYLQKLQPAPSTVSVENWMPRQRGTLIHGGLEAGFLGRDVRGGVEAAALKITRDGLDTVKSEALESIKEECAIIAQDGLDFLPVSDWEPLVYRGRPMVEAYLSAPLPGWKEFCGFADVVARHKPTGRVMIIDHKTRVRFQTPDQEQLALQFILYAHALETMGIKTDGCMVFQIKPELPKGKPRKHRVDDGGIDAPRESIDGRFSTIPTFHSRGYIEQLWKGFQKQALEMSHFKEAYSYPQISGFSCNGCDFKKLCQAELNDMDADYIRANNYIIRDRKPATPLVVV